MAKGFMPAIVSAADRPGQAFSAIVQTSPAY
jgi:hypothetical protein